MPHPSLNGFQEDFFDRWRLIIFKVKRNGSIDTDLDAANLSAGMSVLIFISGILVAGIGLGAYQIRQILHVEKLIPDRNEG